MKKLFLVLAMATGLTALFAQNIPEGRKLFPLAWDYANDTTAWTHSEVQSIDPMADEYVVTGYVVLKNIVGYVKQSYTTTLKGQGNTFTVTCADMETVSCSKDGKVAPSSRATRNPSSTVAKLEQLITDNLTKKITGWTDDEYEAKLNDAVTDPTFIVYTVASGSNLSVKKFFTDNKLMGRKMNKDINVVSVDESKKEGFSYYATLNVFKSSDLSKYKIIFFYLDSNNDKLLSAKKDEMYSLTAEVVDFGFNTLNNFTVTLEEK